MTTILEVQRAALLDELAAFVCKNLNIPLEQIKVKNLRGRVKLARTIFTLAAVDAGVRKVEVYRWLDMDPSFVTQTLNRNFKMRDTPAYTTTVRWLSQRLQVEEDDVKAG